MTVATITSKGQITIPISIRSALGVSAGDRIEFIEVDEGRYEVIAATRDVKELKGLIKPKSPISIDEMNEAIKQRASDLP